MPCKQMVYCALSWTAMGIDETRRSTLKQTLYATLPIASAVLTGTVDFSTMILLELDTAAMRRAAPSQYARLAASPAPMPDVFVGVLTLQHETNA